MNDFAFFLEYEKRLARRRAIEVASDPLIFAGIKKWAKLDIDEKKLFIERYKRLCEEVMHRGMLKLEFFEQAPIDGKILFGSYRGIAGIDGFGKPIRINIHPDVFNNLDILDILDTPAHELAHNYQDDLISNPSILPELFRDPIHRLMKENKTNYISSNSDPVGYRKQPMEEHAFAVGSAFAVAIMDFVTSRAMLRNPFDEAKVQAEYETALKTKRVSINMPMTNCCETADPYRHYYYAQVQEVKLKQSGGRERDCWWEIVQHNQKALICAEYLPYNPRPALQNLYLLAANEFFDEDSKPPRQIQVPDDTQRQARKVLEKFAETGQSREAMPAKGFLRRLDKDKPLPPAHSAPKRQVSRPQTRA